MPKVIQYTFVPGAVAVDTLTDLPGTFPNWDVLVGASNQTEAAGGTASTTSPVEMGVGTSSSPGAGNLYLDTATRQFATGTAFTAGTVLTVKMFARGTSSLLN